MRLDKINIATINITNVSQDRHLILWGIPNKFELQKVPYTSNALICHDTIISVFFLLALKKQCLYGEGIRINKNTFSMGNKVNLFNNDSKDMYIVLDHFKDIDLIITTPVCLGGIFIPFVRTGKKKNDKYYMEIKFNSSYFAGSVEKDEEKGCSYLKSTIKIDIFCLLSNLLEKSDSSSFLDCFYYANSDSKTIILPAVPSEYFHEFKHNIFYRDIDLI